MVQTLGVALGAGFAAVAVLLHYVSGTDWEPTEDISTEVLQRRATTVPETDFPEPMNRAIGGGGATLPAEGGDAELAEGEAEAEAAGFDPDAIAEDDVEYYEVEFAKEGETIEVANNETILEAGEEQGWDLPYSCRQGQCLSCGGQVKDGNAAESIRHSNNDTLSDDELEKGYCLTCTSYPTSDLTIETSETP
ncbi:2Fe-2S iron-sulfur cluster-binding protein [Halorhabdus sp. CUG00001]|uniref:2Fe-2S iron-sulfur cluster-binding protein n=1 Tax=Halorhabdus sp. CUG00001 TaxID=2600297 RepID=UPI00131D4323|nr:2Fe-2S iron-sulfur cluster-binding protein [Halorhabdus sp. CUG00001]